MKNKLYNFLNNIYKYDNKKLFLLLLLFQLPYIIIFFPGLIAYDSVSSITQFFGFIPFESALLSNTPDNVLSNHHMILFTFLMGGAIKLGEILGNKVIGFFLYIFVQIVLTNAIIIFGLYTIKPKVSKKLFIIIFSLYCFFPIYAIRKITMGKDDLYSPFVLLLVILLYKLTVTEFKAFKSFKFTALFILTLIMCSLTNNKGPFIIIVTSVLMLIIYKGKCLKASLCMLTVGLFFLIVFTHIILPRFNVSLSGKQETMGFMFQQTANYVTLYENEVTEEEKESIKAVISYDDLKKLYNPSLQDPVKYKFNQAASDDDIVNYIKIWAKMFFKHPGSYIEATVSNCIGYFFDYRNEKLSNGDRFVFAPLLSDLKRNANYQNVLDELVPNNNLSNTARRIIQYILLFPIISVFSYPSIYAWGVIIIFILCLKNKKIDLLLPIFPLLATILILIVSPIVALRYTLPIVYSLPMVYGFYKGQCRETPYLKLCSIAANFKK